MGDFRGTGDLRESDRRDNSKSESVIRDNILNRENLSKERMLEGEFDRRGNAPPTQVI